MATSRALVNTTGGQVFIDDIGIAVDPSPLYVIPPERYWYFASSSDIDTAIDSGDLIVEQNGTNLNAFDGKCLIHEGTDYVDLLEQGTLVDRNTKEIDFVGCLLRVADKTEGKAEVSIRPLVLTHKACLGFTRKGGFILGRK